MEQKTKLKISYRDFKILITIGNLIGLFLISYVFYYFLPYFSEALQMSFSFYLLIFTLLTILITYIKEEGFVSYLFKSYIYFIILIVCGYFL